MQFGNDNASSSALAALLGSFCGIALAMSIYGTLSVPYLAGRKVWGLLESRFWGALLGLSVFIVLMLFFLMLTGGIGMSAAGTERLSEIQRRWFYTMFSCAFSVILTISIVLWGVPWW